MADPYPKKILPLLEGEAGALRIDRFWAKVDRRGPDECWEWQGSRHGRGYGTFKIASYETVTSSRMALICTKREEPAGLHALHRCDNPPCCNPAHLYFGTVRENIEDKLRRGRNRAGNQSGANNGAAKLTEDQVALIVERLRKGWGNTRIAADLPVSDSMVSLIRLGRMWRSTTEKLGWVPLARKERKAA
jgi:hypothetical protein